MKKTELLIPVGNYENLIAAISNGADAVYLSGKKFGARAFANNFTNEELTDASKLCHLYNVKIYITVNTMIYNDEINDILNYIAFLNSINIDAVIVQDIGLISLIRKNFPSLDVHVSTQAHNYNQDSFNYYEKIGCTRVVLARETSLKEINNIKTSLEKEVFVYGALCICYSGNCLMSSLNGGRSANRGECVGSCRLPYQRYQANTLKENGYLLSTKDINTLPKIKQILDSNISSLKIEGRMKSKEYVAIVTRTFRKLIDEYYRGKEPKLTEEELISLKKVYNREYTTGYLFNNQSIINSQSSNHQGTKLGKIIGICKDKITIKLYDDLKQEDAIRFTINNKGMYINTLYNEKGLLTNKVLKNNICMIDNKFNFQEKDIKNTIINKTIDKELNDELNKKQLPVLNVNMIFKVKNEQAVLQVTCRNQNIISTLPIVQIAQNQPLTKDIIIKQLSKTGQTPFKVQNIKIDIPDNIFINIKDLNELRRQALNSLTTQLSLPNKKLLLPKISQFTEEKANISQISISIRTEEQLKCALKYHIPIIYVNNYQLYNQYKNQEKSLYLCLNRLIKADEHYNNKNLLCSDLSSIIRFNKTNNINSNYYLNIANDYAINTLKKENVKTITLSIELSINKLKEINLKKDCEIIVYGLPETMIIKNNIFNIQNNNSNYLKDIKNNIYNIYINNNYTHIMNSKKIDIINSINEIQGFKQYRIELFDENYTETENIIKRLQNIIK